MIVYSSDYFGLLTLLSLNGSAAYRAFLPALFSTIMVVVYKFTWGEGQMGSLHDLTVHPYVIAIYAMAFSLVLNFRLNYSYQRYWEAATQLFMMTSKWVDAATVLASFHYQSTIYDPYRPCPFGMKKREDSEKNNGQYVGMDKKKLEEEDDQQIPQPHRKRTVSDNSAWEPYDLKSSNPAGGMNRFNIAKNAGKRSSPPIAATKHNDASSHGFLNRFFGWGGGGGAADGSSADGNGGNDRPKSLSAQRPVIPENVSSDSVSPFERTTFHRRIPSVDLPRPGEPMVKSFHPTAGKNWETSAKTTRLSHLRKPNQASMKKKSETHFDLESWLSGGEGSPQAHSQPQPPPRRMSLPVQTPLVRTNSKIDVMDIYHSDGAAGDRIYHHHSSSPSPKSSKKSPKDDHHRISHGLWATLLPTHRVGSRIKSSNSLGDSAHLGSPNSNIILEVDQYAETSTTNISTTEQVDLLPSLFLQEAAHLFSLTSAVAMASLRADLEGCASPLVEYVPGQPFPPVNPDEMEVKVWLSSDEEEAEGFLQKSGKGIKALNEYDMDNHQQSFVRPSGDPTTSLPSTRNRKIWIRDNRLQNTVYFLLGINRSPRQRTLYNASRPFAVMGGISDKEVELLQKARGPEAQTALCTLWLKEFISREHLDGSTGNVAPPIVSKVYQFISDGFAQYNQCRKTSYTQFPFVHSQLTIFFLFLSVFVFPYLYYTYVNNVAVACLLNFATMACFDGMHEVAREMQDPFYQFPNDLPLNNYQVQFNEALISCLYGGFHPDSTAKKNKRMCS
jgi:predicted membrane chloride channel (bestrophin family)